MDSRPKAPPTVWGTDLPWSELWIVFGYIAVAGLWVIFTDRAVEWLERDPPEPVNLQTFKGVNFVVMSSLLIYLILGRGYRRRHAAEVRAQEEATRFERAARTSADVIWEWNLETNSFWATLHPIFRTEDDWSIQRKGLEAFRAALHPDDADRVISALQDLGANRREVWSDEFRIRRRDGVYATVVGRTSVIRAEDGSPLRVIGALTDISQRKQDEQRIQTSRNHLRALTQRLQSLREEERILIARELHDDLGQQLTALKLALRPVETGLEALADTVTANPLIDRVVEATGLVDDAIASTQRISTDLRPPALANLGYALALQQEARRFAERAAIPCRLSQAEEELPFGDDASLALYRIFQEALTNIARHAGATEVVAELRRDGRHAVLTVSDNGKGFPPEALADPKSLGLLGMQERALGVGGEIVFARADPQGTLVTLRIPLQASGPNPSPS